MQSYHGKTKVTMLQGYAWCQTLAKDLPLVKGLSAPRSSLEGRPSSRGDHHRAATLPSREGSEKARFGCHIYGIKWLACSQITCNGKGMHESPCTHNFLCSLTKPPAIHELIACQSGQGAEHTRHTTGQGPGPLSWVQTLQWASWTTTSHPKTGVAATHSKKLLGFHFLLTEVN